MSGISSRAAEARRALSFHPQDASAMSLALALGKRGLGMCWPNPSVGAVIADGVTGQILGCGWTGRGGRPHAEAIALAAAGDAARGATMYATLEPCSHWGKTPPCADALLAAGISRLVYGVVDPDPRVAGQGLARLQAEGVEVMPGPFPCEARWLALGHELRVTAGRPFVQVKLAVDADGMVPAGDGAPVWATGEAARAHGHLMRAQADAILVGSGTVEADDPELTCRLPGLADRSPVRVVLSRMAKLPGDAKLLRDAARVPVWIFCGEDAPAESRARLADGGVEVTVIPLGADGRLDLRSALRALAERGITRLLVEGGPTLAASFLAASTIDEAVIFQGPARSPGARIQPFGPRGINHLTGQAGLRLASERRAGADSIAVYRLSDFC